MDEASLQNRADAITIGELTDRAEKAEQTAQEQEQFMKRQGIWQKFLEKQQERQTRHHTR